VILPSDPLLVTPLGTALHAAKIAAQSSKKMKKAAGK